MELQRVWHNFATKQQQQQQQIVSILESFWRDEMNQYLESV